MPKETGLTDYICDRNPEHHKCAKEGTADANHFHEFGRTRSDGTMQNFILCDACYLKCRELMDRHDREFNAFMKGKE